MGSLTPPWADELLSRNTKIARKMMSSMSTESYLLDTSGSANSTPQSGSSQPQRQQRPNRFLSIPVAHPSDPPSPRPVSPGQLTIANTSANKVVDPLSSSIRTSPSSSSQSPTTCSSSLLRNNNTNISSSSSATASFSNKLTRNTGTKEKLSPIRNERDSMFVDGSDEESTKKGGLMTINGNGVVGGGGGAGHEDLSIIEYGPGIVKKLRSRYQSLALRQYTARPSLRRSASLENCLDAVNAEDLAATLESKIAGNGHHEQQEQDNMIGNGARQTRPRNRFLPQEESEDGSRNGSPLPPLGVEVAQQNGKSGAGGPRGRTSGHPDASSRRDRMRRARSVDALHRTKREEEILEKFKHVVLPKEEIVIIEVAKPQDAGDGPYMENGSNGIANFSTPNSGGVGGERGRFPTRLLLTANNFRSSGLDQQKLVRNLMISPEHELPPHDIVRETARIFERNQENLNRRIGQALRLTKSQSASAGLGLVDGVATGAAAKVTAQSTPMQDNFTTGAKPNGPAAAAATSPSSAHGQKQIGIIKPTLSNGQSVNSVGSGVVNGGAVIPPPVSNQVVENNRVRSPILSPIGYPNKPLLQHQKSLEKPPLSPKPIFTSSPKLPQGPTSAAPQQPQKGKGVVQVPSSLAQEPSPSPSPILIIENQRSLSPFKSSSPVPARVKSPEDKEPSNNAFMRPSSPNQTGLRNGKQSPPVLERLNRTKSPDQQQQQQTPKEVVFVVENKVNNKTVTQNLQHLQNGQSASTTAQSQGSSDHHRQQITRAQDQIPAPPPRTLSPATTPPPPPKGDEASSKSSSAKPVSQLRVHQSKKSNGAGNGSMVFNFTSRKAVPDYIEDDGLRKGGSMTPQEEQLLNSADKDSVDNKIIPNFVGANVIINGRSSIQKKPKSQKLSISFNESATTTHEYPSESSFAIEEESTLSSPDNNTEIHPQKPSVISSSTTLGSYTPKTGATNTYQLGSSYTTSAFDGGPHTTTPAQLKKKQEDAATNEANYIEDYLKPNTESTTWSNEMSSDILF